MVGGSKNGRHLIGKTRGGRERPAANSHYRAAGYGPQKRSLLSRLLLLLIHTMYYSNIHYVIVANDTLPVALMLSKGHLNDGPQGRILLRKLDGQFNGLMWPRACRVKSQHQCQVKIL